MMRLVSENFIVVDRGMEVSGPPPVSKQEGQFLGTRAPPFLPVINSTFARYRVVCFPIRETEVGFSLSFGSYIFGGLLVVVHFFQFSPSPSYVSQEGKFLGPTDSAISIRGRGIVFARPPTLLQYCFFLPRREI